MGSVFSHIAATLAKAWRCRKLRIAAVVLVLLIVTQVITYSLIAPDPMPSASIRQLADYGLFETIEWVLVEREDLNALTEAQRADLEAELRRNVDTIYYSVDDVPESAKHYRPITDHDRETYERYSKEPWADASALAKIKKEIDEGRWLIIDFGFRNGIEISWRIEDRGLFWRKCCAGYYASPICASRRSDLYVWVVFRWVRVLNLSHEIS